MLPEEIQSLHWTQETATVYPITVMRKLGENVRDHLVFISDDKNHDVPFVKKCNEILHDYYTGGFSTDHDIEYNDGCGTQFKCIRAFTSLARRRVKTSRIFTEKSHSKSKSDSLGRAVKSFASRAVCAERRVIRNAEELTAFSSRKLSSQVCSRKLPSYVKQIVLFCLFQRNGDIQECVSSEKYVYIRGTLSIHQVVNIAGNHGQINYINASCGCSFCLVGS